ncbi:MAG: hypothetical protein LBM23_03960 [Propionibacteriaceae bacterium]|jgi:hypothetical protein|nr:hypothetical protein [Propionibacteriaceae bacterium]
MYIQENSTAIPCRLEELWAAACIEAAIPKVKPRRYDDGTKNDMPDLLLYRDGNLFGVCEVTQSTDGDERGCQSEIERLSESDNDRFQGNHWKFPELNLHWFIYIYPGANIRKVKAEAKEALLRLEREYKGETLIRTPLCQGDWSCQAFEPESNSCSGVIEYRLKLNPLPDGGDSNILSLWLEKWLKRPEYEDNVRKILRYEPSQSLERHIFIICDSSSDCPIYTLELEQSFEIILPSRRVNLPERVDAIWISSLSDKGKVISYSKEKGWLSSEKISMPSVDWEKYDKQKHNLDDSANQLTHG